MQRLGFLIVLTLSALPLAAQSKSDTTSRPAPTPTTGYGAWFGSVPEMNSTTAGISLAGVTTGSPAEKAGLKKGDLIISMATAPVFDLQAMVDVLRAHAPGDTIAVVFVRDKAEKTVKVVLGTRPGGR